MSTPHCYICQRWDGSHSGGCPREGFDYRGTDVVYREEQRLREEREQAREERRQRDYDDGIIWDDDR